MKIYADLYEIPHRSAGGRFVVNWHQRIHGGLVPAYTFATYDDGVDALNMVAWGSNVFSEGVPGDHFVVVHDFMDHIDSDLGRKPRVAYLVQADYKTNDKEFVS